MTPRNLPSVPELLSALVDPRLEGAACVSRAPLFDNFLDEGNEPPEEREARHHHARTICRRCPVRAACDTAAGEHDSAGIWAGRLHTPVTTRRKSA
ncbi:hypothetical protein ABH922_000906 [Rhodococcus sp. 27YEA15]|uniref:WhiB family transcriptional regulator n=1 Tax=Rhodococcus sp. 27YEA15 TaxID=3156259 RepID=UPI003C7E3474